MCHLGTQYVTRGGVLVPTSLKRRRVIRMQQRFSSDVRFAVLSPNGFSIISSVSAQ